MTAITLGFITLLTSTLTGVIGMGGGLLLLGIMPIFLPAAAIIPVHGVTQLASNSSRAWFGRSHINWDVMSPFILGGVFGTACFALVLRVISLDYLPIFIACYILLSQWSNVFNKLVSRIESFTLLGFFQVGLSLLSGTIGPVHMVLLNKRYGDKDEVVATAAALMTVKHGLKVIAFAIVGVKLWQYGDVMLAMIAAAIVGSYIGTKLRGRLDKKRFAMAMKIILSILAVNMLLTVFR